MKIIYCTTGILAFVLGTIGAFLPALPTVPFYLLATWCFAKGSDRLRQWLERNPLYQKHMAPFFRKEGLTIRQKVTMMSLTTILMLFAFVLMGQLLFARIILMGAWLFHLFYFVFRIKTRKGTALVKRSI